MSIPVGDIPQYAHAHLFALHDLFAFLVSDLAFCIRYLPVHVSFRSLQLDCIYLRFDCIYFLLDVNLLAVNVVCTLFQAILAASQLLLLVPDFQQRLLAELSGGGPFTGGLVEHVLHDIHEIFALGNG